MGWRLGNQRRMPDRGRQRFRSTEDFSQLALISEDCKVSLGAVLPYCCHNIVQPAILRIMGMTDILENAQNSHARVKGCGKSGQDFTLYYVHLIDGTGRPMMQGFHNLACGSCASTFQKMTYGIVLCQKCAAQLSFPPLLVTKAKTPRR